MNRRVRFLEEICFGLVVIGSVPSAAPESPAPAADFVEASPSPQVPETISAALAGIRTEALSAHVGFLSSPALEGRGLGSRGLDAAAEYAAAFLGQIGMTPLGSEETGFPARPRFFQSVPLREVTGFTGEISIEMGQGKNARRISFTAGPDCVFDPAALQSLTAQLAIAGYGIREQTMDHDDYKELGIQGRVVMILGGIPPGESWRTPVFTSRYAAEEREDRWRTKVETAHSLGAAAVIAVDLGPQSGRRKKEDTTPPICWLPRDKEAEPLPVVYLSAGAARSLLTALGLLGPETVDSRPRNLPEIKATFHTRGKERLTESRNVIGFLPGGDPVLRDEAVMIGAHLDHLGLRKGVIHPGADDNASGVAALLEIARGMASFPAAPKRSVIVAFWTGEEEGKFGSGYFVRHPRWPLSRIAVYINLDMIGHPWLPEELTKLVTDSGLPDGAGFLSRTKVFQFAEPGLPVDDPKLAEALRWAGPAVGMALHLDRCDGTHGGSDYRDFARAGVPWIRFFGNFFPGYHEPGDTPEALDPAQVQRMTRLAFATACRLADR